MKHTSKPTPESAPDLVKVASLYWTAIPNFNPKREWKYTIQGRIFSFNPDTQFRDGRLRLIWAEDDKIDLDYETYEIKFIRIGSISNSSSEKYKVDNSRKWIEFWIWGNSWIDANLPEDVISLVARLSQMVLDEQAEIARLSVLLDELRKK